MKEILFTVLDMSITGSYIIALVILLRTLIKKVPKIFSYILWIVPFLRLLVPFSIESVVSLVPSQTQNVASYISDNRFVEDSVVVFEEKVESVIPQEIEKAEPQLPAIKDNITIPQTPSSVEDGVKVEWLELLFGVYLAGVGVLLGYSVVSYFALKRKVSKDLLVQKGIYICKNIKTPFVLGFINPAICLPSTISNEEKSYIVKHEQTHIRRCDHLIKPIAFLAVVFHWFNPFVWIAFNLLSRDMEMSCDEAVLKNSDIETKRAYSKSLINLSVRNTGLKMSPLAFGESPVKKRVKNIVYYKKPSFWVSVVVVVIVAGVSIGLLFNQPDNSLNADTDIDVPQKEQSQTDKPINDNDDTQNTQIEEVEDEDGVLVVSSVPKMSEENQMCYDRYIKDVAMAMPILENFSKDDYFKTGDPYLMFGYAFSKEFGYSLGEEGKDNYNGFYPADLVESLISKYFVFNKEEIMEIVREKCTILETEELPEDRGQYYNSTKEVFCFGAGKCEMGIPLSAVTGVEKKGDNQLFIYVTNYMEYYNEEGVLQEGLQVYSKNVVEIELSDGKEPLSCGFKIVGNKVDYFAKNMVLGTPEIDLPPAEFIYEGLVLLYEYYPAGEIYQEQAVSFEECMSATGKNMEDMTIYDLVFIFSKKCKKELPIKSISQEKGMVVIDFSGEFLSMYDKNEISVIMNSLATTLSRNCMTYEWLLPKVDGEVGLLSSGDGNNGEFKPVPFKLIQAPDEAKLKAIRDEIPYKMSGIGAGIDVDEFVFIEKNQAVEDVYDYLFRLGNINKYGNSEPNNIYSAADIENELLLKVLIDSTQAYYTTPMLDEVYYDINLQAIAATLVDKLGFEESMFWIKEHIEETARYFFGEDYVVNHQSFSVFSYFEEEGVYTPPHMGIGGQNMPYIHSYKEVGDEVKIEVSYIMRNMGGYTDNVDGEWVYISYGDARTYALNSAQRYEVTLNKTNDGGFKFVSSIMK